MSGRTAKLIRRFVDANMKSEGHGPGYREVEVRTRVALSPTTGKKISQPFAPRYEEQEDGTLKLVLAVSPLGKRVKVRQAVSAQRAGKCRELRKMWNATPRPQRRMVRESMEQSIQMNQTVEI